MELVELGGESPHVAAPTRSPQATAGPCMPRPRSLVPSCSSGGGQMGGVMEWWGWGELSLGSPGRIKGLEASGFGEAAPGGAESGCCWVGFGWTQEGAELGRQLSSLGSRLAQGGV